MRDERLWKTRLFIRREKRVLSEYEHGQPLFPVEWLPRPAAYEKTTSHGLSMTSIREMAGEDGFSVCHTNACLRASSAASAQ